MLPSPGLQASFKEVISINKIRERKPLKIEAPESQRSSKLRLYNARSIKLYRDRKLGICKRANKAIVEVFNYRQTFDSFRKVVLD